MRVSRSDAVREFESQLGIPSEIGSSLYDAGYRHASEVRDAPVEVLAREVPGWGDWMRARVFAQPVEERPPEQAIAEEFQMPLRVAEAVVQAGYRSPSALRSRSPAVVALEVPALHEWMQSRAFGHDAPPVAPPPPWIPDEPRAPRDVPATSAAAAPAPRPIESANGPVRVRAVPSWLTLLPRRVSPSIAVAAAAAIVLAGIAAWEIGPPLTSTIQYYPPLFYCASDPCQSFSVQPDFNSEFRDPVAGMSLLFTPGVSGHLKVEVARGDVARWTVPFDEGEDVRLRFGVGQGWADMLWSLEFGSVGGAGFVRLHEISWSHPDARDPPQPTMDSEVGVV